MLNWAGCTVCHGGMTPQASGYGRRDWGGYGQEAIFIPSFTVMIQVRGYSFMAKGSGDRLLLYDYGELRWLISDNP